MMNPWKRLVNWVSSGKPKEDWTLPSYGETKTMPDGRTVNYAGNEPIGERTIISMSAEDTANWLADPASEPWTKHIVDPELKRHMTRQQQSLRTALYDAVELFEKALWQESERTSRRLMDLRLQSQAGDVRATELMVAMLGELISQALVDMA